jgi:rhodanese-related sulfurtransferase
LLAEDEQSFFGVLTEDQPPSPGYFLYDAILNREDRELLDETRRPVALDLETFDSLVSDGAMVVDGRDPEDFAAGHLVGSINVGLDGRYAEFAGSVVPTDADVVLVVDDRAELEAKNRLARIGFDRVVGYLVRPQQVMIENPERVRRASRLPATDFDARRDEIDGLQLVDIRNPGETALGTIGGAQTIPVGQLPGRLDELDPNAPTVVYCAGGYRSSVAASLLRQAGFVDVSDIVGGYGAWTEARSTSV